MISRLLRRAVVGALAVTAFTGLGSCAAPDHAATPATGSSTTTPPSAGPSPSPKPCQPATPDDTPRGAPGSGARAMWDAVRRRDATAVTTTATRNPRWDVDHVGDRLILEAVRFDCLDVAAALLAAGAPVNADRIARTTPTDWPLQLAAEQNNLAMVNLLLRRGAAVNPRGVGFSHPLEPAYGAPRGAVLRRLLEAGLTIPQTRGTMKDSPISAYLCEPDPAADIALLVDTATARGHRPDNLLASMVDRAGVPRCADHVVPVIRLLRQRGYDPALAVTFASVSGAEITASPREHARTIKAPQRVIDALG